MSDRPKKNLITTRRSRGDSGSFQVNPPADEKVEEESSIEQYFSEEEGSGVTTPADPPIASEALASEFLANREEVEVESIQNTSALEDLDNSDADEYVQEESSSEIQVSSVKIESSGESLKKLSAAPLSVLLPRLADVSDLVHFEAAIRERYQLLKNELGESQEDEMPYSEESMLEQILDWLSNSRSEG